MINLKNIIKNTLTQLKKKNLLTTPENYYKEFLLQSKLVDLSHNEKNILSDMNQNLLSSLRNILTPSIDTTIQAKIDNLISYLKKNPETIFDQRTTNQIETIVQQRIDSDKQVVKNKSKDFNKITILMSKYFKRLLLESGNSSTIITSIKDELEQLSISENSKRELGILHGKLISTIHSIEVSLEKNKNELLNNEAQFAKLEETIKKLQKDVEDAKEENKIDYLTNIFNKRAFDEESKKFEQTYNMFGRKYAIIFYDIDHFKNINDSYGHECGDAILRTFAGILKDLSRSEDIIARYGGEEFVVLFNYISEDEIQQYTNRVKQSIQNNHFNYKEHKDITLKFSAGIALRKSYDTFQDTLETADQLLYKAKKEGRDRIYFE